MKADITIGTRGSPLALWQANWVKAELEKKHQAITVELMPIQTKGDKILDTPLAMVGGKGLFVKELETALLDNSVDIAVHSMKDVPTILPEGLEISVICEREDPRDAFIARDVMTFSELPEGARVGTSSLRRQAQILSRRPDIEIVSIRGNVGTRLKKIESENLDATILAAAGLKRMEMEEVVTEYIDPSDCLPAVAQGAMGIETRVGDEKTVGLINFLNHRKTALTVEAERAFLKRLEGGCQAPIAGYATLSGSEIELTGLVGVTDGSVIYRETMRDDIDKCTDLGIRLAEKILNMGGDEILREAYGEK